MSHKANDLYYEDRQQWLDERGCLEGDVMSDSKGDYIIIKHNKIYLPDKIQSGFAPEIKEN